VRLRLWCTIGRSVSIYKQSCSVWQLGLEPGIQARHDEGGPNQVPIGAEIRPQELSAHLEEQYAQSS
jgi:hypothetical protein